MSKQLLSDAIDNIGVEQIEKYNNIKEKLRKRKHTKTVMWHRLGVVAVCFALVFAMIPIGILISMQGRNPVPDNPPEQVEVGTIVAGDKITGVQGFEWGSKPSSSGSTDLEAPCFMIQTVLEVSLIEVLPDRYVSTSGAKNDYYIAKFRVTDQVTGNGFPEIIYLRYKSLNEHYAYGDVSCDKHFFDGYDSFIISVSQIGIENYLAVNKDKAQFEYFPNMFEAYFGVTYGAVIAFNGGVADGSFYERCVSTLSDAFKYKDSDYFGSRIPMKKGDSIGKVKARIKTLANEPDYHLTRKADDCLTASDIFVGDDEKSVWEYVNTSGNYFSYDLYVSDYYASITFTRNINGFDTNEKLYITHITDDSKPESELEVRNEIIRVGEQFTSSDLATMPDIATVISGLEPETITAPHTTVEGLTARYITVSGKYIKVDGDLYGVVSVYWWLTDASGIIYRDDMFMLTGNDGILRTVERGELIETVGDIILRTDKFEYNMGSVICY